MPTYKSNIWIFEVSSELKPLPSAPVKNGYLCRTRGVGLRITTDQGRTSWSEAMPKLWMQPVRFEPTTLVSLSARHCAMYLVKLLVPFLSLRHFPYLSLPYTHTRTHTYGSPQSLANIYLLYTHAYTYKRVRCFYHRLSHTRSHPISFSHPHILPLSPRSQTVSLYHTHRH